MQDAWVVRLVTIGISLAIGVLALVLRAKTRSSTHPGVIFALFWCLMTLVPILGVPELVASPAALAYIFAAALAFGLPAFFIDWRPAAAAVAARRGRALPEFSSRGLVLLFVALQVVPIICIGINLQMQGYPLSALITDPLATGCRYLSARYSGAIHPNFASQAGTVLNYIGAPIGGLIVASRKGWRLRLTVLILSFLPSILDIFIYADKGTIFLTAAYFYGAVIVARIAAGNTALFTRTTIATCVVTIFVLVPIVGLAMLNRAAGSCIDNQRTTEVITALKTIAGDIGAKNEPPTAPGSAPPDHTAPPADATATATTGLIYSVRSYAFAQLFNFSDWFDHRFFGAGTISYADPSSPTWGFWTFMAIGRFLSPTYYHSLPPGYFEEYFIAPGIIQTNISTFFRGVIYDFTIFGSLIFFLFLGWILGALYKQMLLAPRAIVAQALFVFFIGFVYTSFIISLLIWNSAYLAFIGFLAVLSLSRRAPARKGFGRPAQLANEP